MWTGVLLISVLLLQYQHTDGAYSEQDGDCGGNDISEWYVPREVCSAYCTTTPRCVGWAYVEAGTAPFTWAPCYLKAVMCEAPAQVPGLIVTSYVKVTSEGSGLHTFGCDVGVKTRCHHEGITKENCELGGCCFDATATPACYHSVREAVVAGFQRRGGGCFIPVISQAIFSVDQCRTQCLLTETCAMFGNHMTTQLCSVKTGNCRDDQLDLTDDDFYTFDSMAHQGYMCMQGLCPWGQYDTQNYNARGCAGLCTAGCLGFTMHFSNGLSFCTLHDATCTPADLDTSPLNAYYCHKGPVIEGVSVPRSSHLTLVDADSATCLDVPFTPSRQHQLRIQYGWPTAQSSSTAFTLQLQGTSLLCTQRRTMAYVTTDASPGELRHPDLNSDQKLYRTCTLTSSDAAHCSYSCSCDTHCSTLFVSVLTEKTNQSWSKAKLCEVTFTV